MEVKCRVAEIRVVELEALVEVGIGDDLLAANLVHQTDGMDGGVVDGELTDEVLGKRGPRLLLWFVQPEMK